MSKDTEIYLLCSYSIYQSSPHTTPSPRDLQREDAALSEKIPLGSSTGTTTQGCIYTTRVSSRGTIFIPLERGHSTGGKNTFHQWNDGYPTRGKVVSTQLTRVIEWPTRPRYLTTRGHRTHSTLRTHPSQASDTRHLVSTQRSSQQKRNISCPNKIVPSK